jgi:hypothetical protein
VSSDKTLQGIVEGGSEEHEYGKEEQCVKAEQVDDAGRGVFNGRNTDALYQYCSKAVCRYRQNADGH